MINQMDPSRASSILNLRFGAKMKIAWRLFRLRALAYSAISLLIVLGLGSAFFVAIWLSSQFLVFLVLFIPLLIFTAFIQIGFHRSVLRFMDGLEPNLQITTFFEPLTRIKQLIVPMLVFGICFLVANFIVELLDMIPLFGWIISLPLSAILNLILGAYNLFWAENEQADIGECLGIPISLFAGNLESWFSALLGSILVYLPAFILIFIIVFSYLLLGHSLGALDFLIDDPEYYNPYGGYGSAYGATMNTGALVSYIFFGFITLILLLCAYIYSTFLYAIAYKQSMAKRQLMPSIQNWTNTPPPGY